MLVLYLEDPTIVERIQRVEDVDAFIDEHRPRISAAGTLNPIWGISWKSEGLGVETPAHLQHEIDSILLSVADGSF